MRNILASQNRILASIPAEYWPVIEPGLTLLDLGRGDTLDFFRSGLKAFFPITAVISIVARLPDGSSAQVALNNHDTCIGVARCFMPSGPTGLCTIFAPGVVASASQACLVSLKDVYPEFLMTIFGLSRGGEHIFAHQAVCAASHPVSRRIASWLLYASAICHRRELEVSQQQLADYLAARRETVGTTLVDLENKGIISRTRGTLVILSQARLEAESCGCAPMLLEGHQLMRPPERSASTAA